MRTLLPGFMKRMERRLAQGTPVTVQWVQWPDGTPVDPTTGAKLGVPTEMTATFRGFVHFVTATTGIRQFRETEVGDVVVDLPADVAVDGKEQVRFVIDGQVYVARDIGNRLQKLWDCVEQGQRLCRTLLLRKAT